MADPLVSVIVISHDYGRFLVEAIESALAQSYPRLEHIVIDDGSTDDSVRIAGRYDEIRLLTQENRGVERTCNRAAAEAEGEFFTFLSADDRFEPTYVEELMAALERRPGADFAYCASRLFGAASGVAPARPFSAFSLVLGRNYVNGSALTRRSAYLESGGYAEDLGELGFEDWDFWLRMVEQGRRGTYVPKPLLNWRRHPEGSRNPSAPDALARSSAHIRERHREIYESLAKPRRRADYLLDRGIGLADRLVGLSRSPRLLAAAENGSWRRFSAARREAAAPGQPS